MTFSAPRRERAGLAAAMFLALALGSGCAPTISSATAAAVKGATPAIVDSSLDQMEDEATRQRMMRVLGSPEVQESIKALTADVSKGVLAGLTDEEVKARTADLVRSTTQAMLASMTSRENLAALSKATETVTASAVHGAMRAIKDDVGNDLGPEIRRVMTEEVGPAITQVLRERVVPGVAGLMNEPALRDSLAGTVRLVAKEAVIGSNEGLAQLEHERPTDGLLANAVRLFTSHLWIAALGALAVVLVLWRGAAYMRKSREERRQERRDRDLHDAVLATMTRTMAAADGKPWADELKTAILRDLERDRADGRGRVDGPAPRSVPHPPPSAHGAH